MNRSAFRFPKPAEPLGFDGERFVSGLLGNALSGDIESEHYHRYLFALQFCGGKDVLDIASGEGYGSFCLGQVASSVVGVDANAGAVDFANRNYLSERVSFKAGTAQSIPIADASIDVVVSFETLEHFTEHEEFASEVRRVLRPGGLLVISSPNRTVYTEEANYKNEWHLRELDRSEFVQYLSASFAHVRMFAQRPMAGSIIAVDDAETGAGKPQGFMLRGEGLFQCSDGIPHPPFFVALASDAALGEVRSSVLQNPSLLRHIDTQRQAATDDAARAVARVAELEQSLAQAEERLREQTAALVSCRKQAEATVQQDVAEALRTLKLAGQSAERIEAVRQELTGARRRNLELAEEAEALRRERDELTGVAEALRGERDAHAGAAETARRERDERAGEAATFCRERDEHAGEAERLRLERDQFAIAAERLRLERAGEADGLRRERDEYAIRLHSILGSTTWRATWPLRRVGSILPQRLRRPIPTRGRAEASLAAVAAGGPDAGEEISDPAPVLAQGAPADLGTADLETAELAPPVYAPPDVSPPALVQGDPPPPDFALPIAPPTTAVAVETRPSDLRRQLDEAWVEPNERPDFIRLGGMSPRSKIAVVVHVYYLEVWQELAEAICNIKEDFDLFVTLVIDAADALEPTIREQFPHAEVLLVDNHGRDVFPFLALIRTGVLFGYELICKIHSKGSRYREGGDEWRKALVGGILGSSRLVDEILDAFRTDPDLGVVVAPDQMFGGRMFWISNEARSAELLREIGLNESAFERDFAGGSIFWIRPLILRPINALRLGYDDFEAEPISEDGYTAHAVERLFSVVCHDAGMRIADSGALVSRSPARLKPKVHVIANYLPQFHPTPENDAWWGKGFTEWSNVTKAVPLFRGHRQPRLPADLGFYDLRLAETRAAQADLARRHGVAAFSYYYYWFNGRTLLNKPIEAVLGSGEPDFPFMLCWANEPWTRNWDGLAEEILMPQDYAPGWECAFAADAAEIMRDPRYLRLNGKPMLAVYRVAHFPDTAGSIARLRAAFRDEGFPDVHLVGAWVQVGNDEALPPEPSELGLDGYFEFPPHGIASQPLEMPAADRMAGFAAHTYDYGATIDAVLDQLAIGQSGFRYRGVMMGWDNTARRGEKSFVFHGATPANFRRWLRAAVRTARTEAREAETAVFINAWNEWAEGTYLEPDRDFGTGWLEAVASATADGDTNAPNTEMLDSAYQYDSAK